MLEGVEPTTGCSSEIEPVVVQKPRRIDVRGHSARGVDVRVVLKSWEGDVRAVRRSKRRSVDA